MKCVWLFRTSAFELHHIFEFKYENCRRCSVKQEKTGYFLLLQIRRSIYNEVDLRFPDRQQTIV